MCNPAISNCVNPMYLKVETTVSTRVQHSIQPRRDLRSPWTCKLRAIVEEHKPLLLLSVFSLPACYRELLETIAQCEKIVAW